MQIIWPSRFIISRAPSAKKFACRLEELHLWSLPATRVAAASNTALLAKVSAWLLLAAVGQVASLPFCQGTLAAGPPSPSPSPARGEASTCLRAAKQDVAVFDEPGRYGGWPANGGVWSWGNEIVAGFTAAWYKAAKNDHAVDRSRPFEKCQARSLDGGRPGRWKSRAFPTTATRRHARP